MIQTKFSLGRMLITPTAQSSVAPEDVMTALGRHITGDWGGCCHEDREANDTALQVGERLFSVYHDGNGIMFWVITEWDRSVTTVLLPEDY